MSEKAQREIDDLARLLLRWRNDPDAISNAEPVLESIGRLDIESLPEDVLLDAIEFVWFRHTDISSRDFLKNVLEKAKEYPSPFVQGRARGYLLRDFGDASQLEPLADIILKHPSSAVEAVASLKMAVRQNIPGAASTVTRLLASPSLDYKDTLLEALQNPG